MNGTLNQLFEEFQGHDSWMNECVFRVFEAARKSETVATEIIAGLVGLDGARGVLDRSTDWNKVLSEDVWGINIDLCNKYCGRSDDFPMVRTVPS
jgi:hypothetical protein